MKKEFTLIEITDYKPIKKWSKLLMGKYKKQAELSLASEEVDKESVFYLTLDGKKYLAFYMEGNLLPADMTMEVNKKHREVLKGIRKRKVDGELLYSLP